MHWQKKSLAKNSGNILRKMSNVVIGSDHAGFELKEKVKDYLKAKNINCEDIGCNNTESVDYPDYASKLASLISNGAYKKGILICGTGIGMSIAANKFENVRAALCYGPYTALMARKHNDSNVLVLGSRVIEEKDVFETLEVWLTTEFEGGRHKQRVDKLNQLR